MKSSGKLKSAVRYLVFTLLITFFLFACLEGCCSLAVFFIKLRRSRIVAERIHTEYDPLLGWINRPDVHIEDMYGPKKYFRTNSQRFRNERDFESSVPAGKSRWICSGDSFTLGYGVDNDHTWCALLSSLVPGLETVNMGQGGYGIDQSYLWFMRDGVKLQYDVLVFAFVTADFARMMYPRLRNYPKPLLSIREGEIVRENVPVPRPGFLIEYLPRIESALNALAVTKITRILSSRLKDRLAPSRVEREILLARAEELTLRIFQSLNDYNEQNNRTVLFVYLPTEKDRDKSGNTDTIRNFLHSQAERNGWFLIDLIDDFRGLDREAVDGLFIQRNIPGYTASSGHYTAKGNRYIAGLIIRRIKQDPALSRLLPVSGEEET